MLPILLFEVTWKVIWLGVVGVPHVVAGDADAAMNEMQFNCSLVVVVIAVVPWRHVWRQYVHEPGDNWYRRPLSRRTPVPSASDR